MKTRASIIDFVGMEFMREDRRNSALRKRVQKARRMRRDDNHLAHNVRTIFSGLFH